MIQCISGVDCVKKETIKRNSRSFMVDHIKKEKERVKNICELSKNHDDFLNEISNT